MTEGASGLCHFAFAPCGLLFTCKQNAAGYPVLNLHISKTVSNNLKRVSVCEIQTLPEIAGVCFFVGCLTSQQHASVSQGRICSDNFTCCHTEIEVADQTFYLTQSQYTDTGPTSPSSDPITPGAWQGSHWSANF